MLENVKFWGPSEEDTLRLKNFVIKETENFFIYGERAGLFENYDLEKAKSRLEENIKEVNFTRQEKTAGAYYNASKIITLDYKEDLTELRSTLYHEYIHALQLCEEDYEIKFGFTKDTSCDFLKTFGYAYEKGMKEEASQLNSYTIYKSLHDLPYESSGSALNEAAAQIGANYIINEYNKDHFENARLTDFMGESKTGHAILLQIPLKENETSEVIETCYADEQSIANTLCASLQIKPTTLVRLSFFPDENRNEILENAFNRYSDDHVFGYDKFLLNAENLSILNEVMKEEINNGPDEEMLKFIEEHFDDSYEELYSSLEEIIENKNYIDKQTESKIEEKQETIQETFEEENEEELENA